MHSSRAATSKSQVIPTTQSTSLSLLTSLAPTPTPTLTSLPISSTNQAQQSQNLARTVTRDLNEVYNCASQISNKLLVGPSIINAPAKNKISLPSISELDCMIDNTGKMMHVLDDARHKWFIPGNSSSTSTMTAATATTSPPPPVTQYRALVSNNPQIISPVKQDGRTTVTKRPLKRQRTTSNKSSTSTSAAISFSKKHQTQCHSCKSTETPEWRKGPLGPRTLCNACGLIWTKLCKQQEEDDRSRRKFRNNSSLSTSSSAIIEDRNNSTFSSSSVLSSPLSTSLLAATAKDNNESSSSSSSKKKLDLSFLLS